MRYPPSVLEEIRSRLPVSTVVGRRVRLKKAGREWKGLSPFNSEKTPSFTVNDQKQFYHCFSSGRHGDIFSFLMETEGVSFPEAVERLAAEAGVPLPAPSAEDHAAEEKRNDLYEVMELTARFFETALTERSGATAMDYLARRGMSEASRQRFRLGYAPNGRYVLRDYLASRNVPPQTMIDAGLLIHGEDIAVPFDRFRDRLMFPILDTRGRVVAFGGRALSAETQPKYLNSPDTPLFNKGRLLYNHFNARKAVHERGAVVVVEGYMDVIAMDSAGFGHTVAPLGTALTEDQLRLLWRMADEPFLCFDGDKAGRRAAFRALDLAMPLLTAGKSLSFAFLPEGQDPDDLIRANGGGAVERVLAAAKPLVDVLWTREIEAGPLDTPERRAALARRLRDTLSVIGDETLKYYYRDEIDARLDAINPRSNRTQRRNAQGYGQGAGYGQGTGGGWKRADTRGQGYSQPGTMQVSPQLAASALFSGSDMPRREALILGVFLKHGQLLPGYAEELANLGFTSPVAPRILDILLDLAASEDDLSTQTIINRLERAGLAQNIERILGRVTPGDRWQLGEFADEQRLREALHQAINLQRRNFTLNNELKAAERAFHEDPSELHFIQLQEVKRQLSSLDGVEAEADDH